MTSEDAIQVVEYIRNIHKAANLEGAKVVVEALETAIAALRAQAEAEKAAPLTLDELWEMDGQPVWCTEKGSVCPAQSWGIVSNLNDIVPGSGFCIIGAQFAFLQDKYGETWLAYRRKPKEE